MKIHVVQPNCRIGDFPAILRLGQTEIAKAKSAKADIIVFPEMFLVGYPALDLLNYPEFLDRSEQLAREFQKLSDGIGIIVGGPERNDQLVGKALYNTAFFFHKGDCIGKARKMLLPTYDIFDEYRYFQPAQEARTITFKGKAILISICEDLWNASDKNLYGPGPLDYVLEQGDKPDYHINIAASPFSAHQMEARTEILQRNMQKHPCPLVYSNYAGTQTELIFDGDSQVWLPDGTVWRAPLFEAHGETVDLDQLQPTPESSYSTLELQHKALVAGVRDYFGKMQFKKAILGLSGGIDSALVAQIATEALGKDNVLGVLLPSQYSSSHSVSDAEALAKNLGINTETIAIEPAFKGVYNNLPSSFDRETFGLAEENFQARIRGVYLMGLSNKWGHVLLNTTNKSEAAVGYGTLYGDMCGGLSVIGDLYKTAVFEMCRWLNRDGEVIPWNTIEKPPSAELRPDQKDSDSLPEYSELDTILRLYIEEQKGPEYIIAEGHDPALVTRIIGLVNRNEFKRFQAAPILRISSKAFGFGRRIPLVSSPLGLPTI